MLQVEFAVGTAESTIKAQTRATAGECLAKHCKTGKAHAKVLQNLLVQRAGCRTVEVTISKTER